MGLTPFLALAWKEGPDTGTLWESGHPLEHAQADLGQTPLRCDAITDNHTLFAVGYGVGALLEDDCFEPTTLEGLKLEATAIHVHQLCAFIATDVDPLPFADPMLVTDAQGLSQYVATLTRRPTSLSQADAAIDRLLAHFSHRLKG